MRRGFRATLNKLAQVLLDWQGRNMGSDIFLRWAGRPTSWQAPAYAGGLRLSEPGDPRLRFASGDNLQVLAQTGRELHGQVTLVYLDPPFLTNKVHARVRRGRNAAGELERTEVDAFDDRWSSMSEYLEHLAPRLAALRDTLADHGSLVLHVDSKTSHYLKVLCDEIFGPDAFASEIIWRYRRWPAKTRNFQRVHDVLLRYVRNPQSAARFNQLYEPLAASTQATWGTRKQRAVTEASGRRVRSSSTDTPSPGAPLGDVWDIGIVAPVARERTGYPTQKPEVLLQRLITSLTDPDDLVLDPYCGSGTTLAVAHRLGRRVLGIDQGEEAREVTLTRLRAMGARPTVEECSTALAVAS